MLAIRLILILGDTTDLNTDRNMVTCVLKSAVAWARNFPQLYLTSAEM
jgi:hypothetical protein